MLHVTDLNFQRAKLCMLIDEMRVFYELQIEFRKISLDIDALNISIEPVIDKHKVCVDLPAAVLAHHDTNLVTFASSRVHTSN